MDINFDNYDNIIKDINKGTEELAKVNEKIAKITLNKDEEELLVKLLDGYKGDGLQSRYIADHQEEYKSYKNLYKYLKLYRKGLESNEMISLLVSAMSDEVIEDEE